MRHESDEATNELSRRVIGAGIEVHRILGPGYLPSVCRAPSAQAPTTRPSRQTPRSAAMSLTVTRPRPPSIQPLFSKRAMVRDTVY